MGKQKNGKNILKTSKGITLIALIVTIIVLLILAGVSIAMLTGENGILTQARKAKNETENVQENEANILNSYEDYLYNVTGDVPQVNDSNPGILEGSGTEQEPYTINSIEDLVSFADSVTNGNTYEGEYVKLNQSLDFKSDKSYVDPNRQNYYGYIGKLKEALTTGEGFKPIGSTIGKTDASDKSNSFCGVFDGNGKQIINCYMNKNVVNSETVEGNVSFFEIVYGEIKNLGITKANFNLISNNEYGSLSVSGIANALYGKISNCYVTGNLSATQNENCNIYCVGLVTINMGTIENCYNSANLKLLVTKENSSAACYSAGITSNCENENSIIKNCYNTGNITIETSHTGAEVGGIVRYQSAGRIENCYNTGTINCIINKLNGLYSIGGIIGQQTAGGELKNIYNMGNINVSTTIKENLDVRIGGISGVISGRIEGGYNIGNITSDEQGTRWLVGELFGVAEADGIISNSFYINNEPIGSNLSSNCITNKVTSEGLKSNETLNLLNQNGEVWKKDTSNINDGYPIFKWQ